STVAGPGTAGVLGDFGLATAAFVNSPRGLDIDPSGENLLIADLGNNRIRKVNLATGIITTFAGTGDACAPGAGCGDGGAADHAQVSQPTNVSFDSSGNVIINSSNSRVRRVDTQGTITTIAGGGPSGFSGDGGPALLAQFGPLRGGGVDASDNYYIADAGNNRIRRLNVAVAVDVDPDTLDIPSSNGRWVTAYIHVSAGRDVAQIDVGSVRLQA